MVEDLTPEDRRILWLKGSGALQQMRYSHNEGYYTALLEYDMNYPNPCFHQIELDLKRTTVDLNDPKNNVQ